MSLLSDDLWQQLQSVRKKHTCHKRLSQFLTPRFQGGYKSYGVFLRNPVNVSLPGSTWQRKWDSCDTEYRVSICMLGLVIVVSAHTASKKTTHTHTPTFPGSSATKTVIYCICARHRDPVNCNGRMCFPPCHVFTSVKFVQFVCDLTTALYFDLLHSCNKKGEHLSYFFLFLRGCGRLGPQLCC